MSLAPIGQKNFLPELPPTKVDRTQIPQHEVEPKEQYEPGSQAWGRSMTGDIRHHLVKSEIMADERPVWVYLPPSYGEFPHKKYEVLYMHDGQNLFESGTAFNGQEWNVDQVADQAMRQGRMREMIIVAVSNPANKDDKTSERLNQYGPTFLQGDAPWKTGGGRSPEHAQFLAKEVKPMIDKLYRTRSEAAATHVAGSSMGGIASAVACWTMPETFGGAMLNISGANWFDDQQVTRMFRDSPPATLPAKVYIDVGTEEMNYDRNHNGKHDGIEFAQNMAELFAQYGMKPGENLRFHVEHGAGHTEHHWNQRLGQIFEWAFPPEK